MVRISQSVITSHDIKHVHLRSTNSPVRDRPRDAFTVCISSHILGMPWVVNGVWYLKQLFLAMLHVYHNHVVFCLYRVHRYTAVKQVLHGWIYIYMWYIYLYIYLCIYKIYISCMRSYIRRLVILQLQYCYYLHIILQYCYYLHIILQYFYYLHILKRIFLFFLMK